MKYKVGKHYFVNIGAYDRVRRYKLLAVKGDKFVFRVFGFGPMSDRELVKEENIIAEAPGLISRNIRKIFG